MNVMAMEETVYELAQASFDPVEPCPKRGPALGSNKVRLSEGGSVAIRAYVASHDMLICRS